MDELRAIYETTSMIALEHDFTPPAIVDEPPVASQPPARRSA
jgi:hypothetical protein